MKDDRLISLNAAIDAIEKCTDIFLNNLPPTIYKEDAIKAVKALPPAQPDKWEDTVYRKAVQMLLAYFAPEERYAEAVDGLRRLPSASFENHDEIKSYSKDTISRQAEIDTLKNRWKKTRNYEGIGDDIAEECELYLKQVPSAQPEIIHCKDCKHYQFADNRAFGFPVKRCEWTGFEDVDDEDFCSRGERKDGDSNA